MGGATGPVEDDEMKAADPADTPGGATGSPSDEQPASEMPETDLDDDAVGPAHERGHRPRGEQALTCPPPCSWPASATCS